MKFMGLTTSYSWILSMIILNNGIITVNSFPISIDGLIEFGLNFLLNVIMGGQQQEQPEEMAIEDVASKIDDMEKTIVNSQKTIIKELKHAIQYNAAIRDFLKSATYINDLFRVFQTYTKDTEHHTLKNFAKLCLTVGDNGLIYKLHDLAEIIAPSVKLTPSLFTLIIEPYKSPEAAAARCDDMSVQQQIYNMYGEISTYMIKGYAIMFQAYEILRKLDNKIFKKEQSLTRSSFKKVMSRISKSAITAMRTSSRELRPCDPAVDKEYATYIQLKWLFSSWLGSQEHLSKSEWSLDTDECGGHCEQYYATYIVKNIEKLEESIRCNGKIYNCTTTEMRAYCPSETPDKRYKQLATQSNELKNCAHPTRIPFRTQKMIRDMNVGSSCEICKCTCDDIYRSNSVRSFSLAPVESDTEDNKIITGLRFYQKKLTIYIQIQTATLNPKGNVDETTVKWKEIRTDRRNQVWRVNWNQKNVNLDTIIAPAGQVMTGIKFSVFNLHLILSIKTNHFDYSEGTLIHENNPWLSNHNPERNIIKIDEPDIPINADEENIVNIEENPTIQFQMTDWNKDYSQTIVPFLDSQPVYSDPFRSWLGDEPNYKGKLSPLSGAGLYYKGQKNYGGFIGLKLVTYNYAVVLAKSRLTLQLDDELGDDSSDDDSSDESSDESSETTDVELNPFNVDEELESSLGFKFDEFNFEIPEIENNAMKKAIRKLKKGANIVQKNKGRKRNKTKKSRRRSKSKRTHRSGKKLKFKKFFKG